MIRHAKTLIAALTGAALLATVAPAYAGPTFGPAIDSTDYEGQSKCSPQPKPGMVAFQNLVMSKHPWTNRGYISRPCNVGGQSEHKEGRAWDWGVSAGVPAQKAAAEKIFDWLLASDRYGNEAAMARRLGVMYMIFNRKIWSVWGGWDTYCKPKPRGCVDPDDGGLRDPHTSHVHFSLSWAGAYKETTYWHPDRSLVSAIASDPTSDGYWSVARNGAVSSNGAGYYGSKSDNWLDRPIIAMSPSAAGAGYWLLNKAGKVFALGEAVRKGSVDRKVRAAAIASTPSGRGYWVATRGGKVFSFGDAVDFGGAMDEGVEIVSIAGTETGAGYWLFASNGKVFAFGDAPDLGGVADQGVTIAGADNFGSTGYWLVTTNGRIFALGDAQHHGDVAGSDLSAPIAGVATSADGAGYRLITSKGRVFAFGDA